MFKGIVFFIKNGWKYDRKYILWRVLYQFINSLIETFPNPQQSWGESCTQVAIN